jgi:hypothetical protein
VKGRALNAKKLEIQAVGKGKAGPGRKRLMT